MNLTIPCSPKVKNGYSYIWDPAIYLRDLHMDVLTFTFNFLPLAPICAITYPAAQEERLSMEAANSFLDNYFNKHFLADIAIKAYVVSQRQIQSSLYVHHIASHIESGFSALDADVLVKLFRICYVL
jgi:hypothetical protein